MSALKLSFVIEAVDRATAPVRSVNRALDRISEPANRVRAALGSVQAALGNIARAGAKVAAVVGSSLFGFKQVADRVDNIGDTAASLGMTTQRLQEMGYAAQLSGSSQDEMSQALVFLNKSMGEARGGSKEAILMFERVGVTMQDLRKKDAGQIFEKMSDTFQAVGDAGNNAGKKVEVSTALIGRSGYRMIQMMNGGSGGMRALYAEAKRLGVVLSDDTVKAMASFNDSWDRMRLTVFGAIANALTPVAGVLQGVVDRVVKWTAANRGLIATNVKKFLDDLVAGFPAFIEGVKQVVAGVKWFIALADRVVTALGGWPSVIALVAGLMGVQLVGAVLGLAAAMVTLSTATWANPLTWVLAAVVALIAAIPLLVMHWDKVLEKLYQLNYALPDWMRNKDNWLVTKLLPDINIKRPSETDAQGGQQAPLSPPWLPPTGPRPGPSAAANTPARVVARKDSVDVGGTVVIRIDEAGKATVTDIRKATGSPVDFDIYHGRVMATP